MSTARIIRRPAARPLGTSEKSSSGKMKWVIAGAVVLLTGVAAWAFMPARQDRADDRIDDRGAVDERGHGVDEIDALQAETVEHVHLEMDAEIAVAAAPEDRAFEIGARARAAAMEPGGQFGIEADDRARHPPALSTSA